jgi:hypothetical protein
MTATLTDDEQARFVVAVAADMPLETIVIETEARMPENFVPCEALFPQWMTARIILDEFVKRLGRFRVSANGSAVSIHLDQGYPIEVVPPEDREKVRYILENACARFLPDLREFLNNAINESTMYNVLSAIENHAMERLHRGEPSLKDELRFDLGLTPFPQYDS